MKKSLTTIYIGILTLAFGLNFLLSGCNGKGLAGSIQDLTDMALAPLGETEFKNVVDPMPGYTTPYDKDYVEMSRLYIEYVKHYVSMKEVLAKAEGQKGTVDKLISLRGSLTGIDADNVRRSDQIIKEAQAVKLAKPLSHMITDEKEANAHAAEAENCFNRALVYAREISKTHAKYFAENYDKKTDKTIKTGEGWKMTPDEKQVNMHRINEFARIIQHKNGMKIVESMAQEVDSWFADSPDAAKK